MESLGKILVVDDDALTLDALAELLGDEGYEVVTARDGVEAKRVLAETLPDLVISDVAMPKLGGIELVRWLRTTSPFEDMPVILWSANDGTEDRVLGLDVGADDYLGKPVDLDELLAKVRRHLCRASRSRELLIAATVDTLTGVRNRRGLYEVLEAELSRSDRTGQELSLFMVDVDHFKTINDTQGHPAGDEVLRQVAGGLARIIRPYDTIARFGGDEFLIVASGLSADSRQTMQLRLRDSTPGVGLSVGVVTARRREACDELIARADAAMYADKHRRRRPSGGVNAH